MTKQDLYDGCMETMGFLAKDEGACLLVDVGLTHVQNTGTIHQKLGASLAEASDG